MIALLLPWVFGGALVAALVVGVLHLLSVQRPPEMALPTARFLPERQVRAVSRTTRPTDMLLMALRMAALLLAGLAAASPMWRARGSRTVALAVVERGVGTTSDTTAIREMIGVSHTVFAFVGAGDSASVENAAAENATANNAAAVWPVAWRAAAATIAQLSPSDSLVLHLFVRHAERMRSPAALAWATTWPGRVVMHSAPTSAAADSMHTTRRVMVVVNGTGDAQARTTRDPGGGSRSTTANKRDDGVVAALEWHAARVSAATRVNANATANGTAIVDTIFVNRTNVEGANAAIRGAGDTGSASTLALSARSVRIEWPYHGVPSAWLAVESSDSAIATASALIASGEAIVAPFVVSAVPPARTAGAVDIAWWDDGRVAAREQRFNARCLRQVAVTVTSTTDMLLSEVSNRLFDRLFAPCDTVAVLPVGALTTVDTIPAPARSVREFATLANMSFGQQSRSLVVPLLLALALLLLVVEGRLRVRRFDEGRFTGVSEGAASAPSARSPS